MGPSWRVRMDCDDGKWRMLRQFHRVMCKKEKDYKRNTANVGVRFIQVRRPQFRARAEILAAESLDPGVEDLDGAEGLEGSRAKSDVSTRRLQPPWLHTRHRETHQSWFSSTKQVIQ